LRSSAFGAALAAAAFLAAAAEAADPVAAGKERAQPCAACHGEKGISEMENMPSLAAQPDGFIQWQLVYFQLGRRKHEVMEPLAKELSNEEIRNLGAYYASLAPPPPAEGDDDPALSERGAAIAAEHRCGNCHKEDYSGQQATARLTGQREDVLLKSLRDFKSGERSGGGVTAMPQAVAPLSDDELVALAHFLAHRK
jgi:cytochrome c553